MLIRDVLPSDSSLYPTGISLINYLIELSMKNDWRWIAKEHGIIKLINKDDPTDNWSMLATEELVDVFQKEMRKEKIKNLNE